MPQGVRSDPLGHQRRAADERRVGVLADEQSDGVAAERPALAGREQRVLGRAGTLGEPVPQECRGLAGQRGRASLASLALDPDVAAGAEVDVADVQAGQFGDAQPGLDRQRQQRVVAAAVPGSAVRRGKQGVDLAGSR